MIIIWDDEIATYSVGLVNVESFTAGAGAAIVVAPTTEEDRGRDTGSGKRKRRPDENPWWEGEWIDPNEVYRLPEPPPPEEVPLRVEYEDIKERAREVAKVAAVTDAEAKSLRSSVGSLGARISSLEKAAKQVKHERDMDAVLDRYRAADAAAKTLKARVEDLEVRQQILAEDEKFLELIMEYI